MLISQLKFDNFRNLNLEFKPGPEFNVIYGENGKGKSNFLDGIYIISSGKSFKQFKNADNFPFHSEKIEKTETENGYTQDFAKVELLLFAEDKMKLTTLFMKTSEIRVQHRFLLNEKPTLRSRFIYQLKTILFTPASLELLLGSPDTRREQLDDLLATFDVDYAELVKQYSYVMRSRNRLLIKINQGKANKEQLTYWTNRLVAIGVEIIEKREKYLAEIHPYLETTAENLFPEIAGNNFALEYLTDITAGEAELEQEFQEKLEQNFSKEVLIGRTLYGPHRHDLRFKLKERDLHVFGSRGEQRLATMVFKLAAFEFLSKLYNTKIVFLLDDIFSELDKQNKLRLVNYIRSKKAQVFLTTANKTELPKEVMKTGETLEL